MSGEGGRHADLSTVAETLGGTTTLVLGATSHGTACRRLARAGPERPYRLRMRVADPDVVEAASTDDSGTAGSFGPQGTRGSPMASTISRFVAVNCRSASVRWTSTATMPNAVGSSGSSVRGGGRAAMAVASALSPENPASAR
jgi:hypothetical protein